MAHAYETIATGGERVGGNLDASPGPTTSARRPRPGRDRQGHARPMATPSPRTSPRRSASSPQSVANEMKTILRENVLGGTGRLAQSGGDEWGKTGTTENNGDAWFCGGTDHFTACVWVGHADSTQSMETDYDGGPVDGGTYPADDLGPDHGVRSSRSTRAQGRGADKSGSSSTRPRRAPPTQLVLLLLVGSSSSSSSSVGRRWRGRRRRWRRRRRRSDRRRPRRRRRRRWRRWRWRHRRHRGGTGGTGL